MLTITIKENNDRFREGLIIRDVENAVIVDNRMIKLLSINVFNLLKAEITLGLRDVNPKLSLNIRYRGNDVKYDPQDELYLIRCLLHIITSDVYIESLLFRFVDLLVMDEKAKNKLISKLLKFKYWFSNKYLFSGNFYSKIYDLEFYVSRSKNNIDANNFFLVKVDKNSVNFEVITVDRGGIGELYLVKINLYENPLNDTKISIVNITIPDRLIKLFFNKPITDQYLVNFEHNISLLLKS